MVEHNDPSDDEQDISLPILRATLNNMPLSYHFHFLEPYLEKFVLGFEQKRWKDCFDFGIRFAEISLFVIPSHGYYTSSLYSFERKRNFVLNLFVTDLLLYSVLPHILSEQGDLNVNVNGSLDDNNVNSRKKINGNKINHYNMKREASLMTTVTRATSAIMHEAQHLYNVARNTPNYPAVMGDYGNTKGNEYACLTETANRFCDSVISLCSNNQGAYECLVDDRNNGIGTEVTLDHYDILRNDMIAHARADLNHDPLFQTLCRLIDVQTKKEKVAVVVAYPALSSSSSSMDYHDSLSGVRRLEKSHSLVSNDGRRRSSLSLISASSPATLQFSNTFQIEEEGDENMDNDSEDEKVLDEPVIDTVPVESLYQFYLEDYETMKRSKKVEVYNLDTYQGKVKDPETGYDSTNGCTVIAPLIAAQHLCSVYPGISDLQIENVIDLEAPKVLADVRMKLNLPKDALIIPSDVHDFLVDKSILKQEQFLGACGGNIQDEDHLSTFINMLARKSAENEKVIGCKKVAAALFFHEHVISVVKIVFPNGKCWYDVVDSLPYEKEKPAEPKRKRNFGLFGKRESKVEEKPTEEFCALRIRCKDLRSLEATLKWYSLSKFTDDDCKYINSHHWDEKRCYFDPRVFQAFVWADLSEI